MYIKLYFNDKPLFLCDAMTDEIRIYAHHDDAVLIDEFSHPAVNAMIHEMRREKVHAGIFIHPDLDLLKKAFWKKFILVKAGGGLVQNGRGESLFILRRGKWDLPKGKLDPGETIEQCAIREVGEETGLQSVRLEAPLLITYHTYDENGRHILKETHWYRMTAAPDQSVHPQLEEQITELVWADRQKIGGFIKNTFPSIVDVLRVAGFRIDGDRSFI
ncbi:MAG TPA: NUDIX domain-containing protein [Puia sp.]|jgi:8-oxo-dGTP pyrophosphatase MutT (NUDIX family)|nr:NUDIX domain-containing protein [Puia sp.]